MSLAGSALVLGGLFLAGALAGLASMGHCALMCGPLAMCATGTGATKTRGAMAYHLSRLAAYAAIGGAAGYASTLLVALVPGRWVGTLVSFALGTSLLVLAHRLWTPLSSSARRRAHGGADDDLVQLARRAPKRAAMKWRPRHPAALGALTALLPCGTLYAALLMAAATGSVGGGVATMLGFGVTSGLGLALVSVLNGAAARFLVPRAWLGRAMAVALAVAAVVLMARPFAGGDDASCHGTHVERGALQGEEGGGTHRPTGSHAS